MIIRFGVVCMTTPIETSITRDWMSLDSSGPNPQLPCDYGAPEAHYRYILQIVRTDIQSSIRNGLAQA